VRQRLLSPKDASAYLGFSLRSVRNLVYSRELPIIRLGAKIFIDLRDLDQWIEKKKQYACEELKNGESFDRAKMHGKGRKICE
jgi:excisionase family DNA binding protein